MIAGQLEILMFANIARLSDDMRKAERVVSDNMGKVEKSVASAKKAMQSLGMGLSIGLIADQLRRTVDSYTKLDAQLRLSTKSQQSYNQALADIRRISQVAQADISATSMLYTRLMNTMDGTGVSQRKLATVTETVTFGLKAYGATSAEAASASLQLSQAMGANRLGGEEFRAVMEAMPNVMKVLATSMGTTIGGLRKLSMDGKITAAEMIKAWGNPEIAAQFRKYAESAQTITGAMTNVRNELLLLVGEFAKSIGFTGGSIAMFNALAEGVRITATYMKDLVLITGAYIAMSVSRVVYGYVAAQIAQRAAALAVAQAEMVKVNMTYGATAASVAAARASVAQAAANTTLVGSISSVGAAMSRFVAGNPLLVAFASVSTAVVVLKNDFNDAIDAVGRFQEKIRQMSIEALRAERQREVASVAAMKGSIFSGFNERDILFAERRIRMLDQQIIAAEKLAEAEAKLPPPKPTGAGGKPVTAAHTTRMEEIALELQASIDADAKKLTHRQQVELEYAKLLVRQEESKTKLSDKEIAEQNRAYAHALVLADRLSAIERSAKMEALRIDLQTANDSAQMEVTGRISNVDKVRAEWAKFNNAQHADAAELASYEAALSQARIRDWQVLRETISTNLTQGIMTGMENGASYSKIFEDMSKKMFKDMVLEPQIKTSITAGVDWVKAVVANTIATEKNTASQGAGGMGAGLGTMGWAALFGAVAYYGFGLGNKLQASEPRLQGRVSGTGFTGRRTQEFDRAGGWFTSGEHFAFSSALSTAEQRAIKDRVVELQTTFSDLGMQIGLTSTMTKDWSFEINQSGDITKALADGIGTQLMPALELFRREGETLADTAKRLTTVFKSTNDFIAALGVTSAQAFGSYGILSTSQREALIAATGGEQAFAQLAGSFMTNILTPAEQMQASLAAVGKVFSQLNVTGISTKEQFAALVKEMLTKGDYSAVGALLSVADAFAKITSSATDANAQLTALDKNLFETQTAYMRAVGMQRGAVAPGGAVPAMQIGQATAAAGTTVSAEQSAARVAEKKAALDKIDKLKSELDQQIAFFNQSRAMTRSSLGDRAVDEIYNQQAAWANAQYGPRIAAAQAYYDSLPAFATGGNHIGGLRLVGENGPELEATGPSRIYNASQTRAMMSGGSDGSTVTEIRMFREEAKAHAIALTTATQKIAKIADRWDLQGLPPERIAG